MRSCCYWFCVVVCIVCYLIVLLMLDNVSEIFFCGLFLTASIVVIMSDVMEARVDMNLKEEYKTDGYLVKGTIVDRLAKQKHSTVHNRRDITNSKKIKVTTMYFIKVQYQAPFMLPDSLSSSSLSTPSYPSSSKNASKSTLLQPNEKQHPSFVLSLKNGEQTTVNVWNEEAVVQRSYGVSSEIYYETNHDNEVDVLILRKGQAASNWTGDENSNHDLVNVVQSGMLKRKVEEPTELSTMNIGVCIGLLLLSIASICSVLDVDQQWILTKYDYIAMVLHFVVTTVATLWLYDEEVNKVSRAIKCGTKSATIVAVVPKGTVYSIEQPQQQVPRASIDRFITMVEQSRRIQ